MVKLNKGERAGIIITMLITAIASIILWCNNRSQGSPAPELSAKADSFAIKSAATKAVIDSINTIEESSKKRKDRTKMQSGKIQMEPLEQIVDTVK